MKSCFVAALMLCLGALPASAQTVRPCDGWQANAQNLVEPWDETTRTFANGAVRVALLDTVEPAAGSFHLMVLSPPEDELGGRQCRLISADGEMGFAGVFFGDMTAGYDPATGLGLDLPVVLYLTETADFQTVGMGLTINQSTGDIRAEIYPVD